MKKRGPTTFVPTKQLKSTLKSAPLEKGSLSRTRVAAMVRALKKAEKVR